MKTVRVAYLNIAMPTPHTPERYAELFRFALKKRQAFDLRGDFKGLLGSAQVNQGLITGQIYKFFDLDLQEDWFNVAKQKKAEADDLASIQVPENLKPHLQAIDYVFFPRKHRLAFISQDRKETLSPNQAAKFFEGLFSTPDIAARYGDIGITIEPSREQLMKILSMATLQRLRLEVIPPNPDDLDEEEQEVLQRLEDQNAGRMVVEYSAPRSEGLEPSEETRRLAKIAQSNGKVTGVGRNALGEQVVLSTDQHPLVEEASYDENVQPRVAALIDRATRTIARLLG